MTEDRKIVSFPTGRSTPTSVVEGVSDEPDDGRELCRSTNITGVPDTEYKSMVLAVFDQLEHEDKREFLDRKVEVQRAARQRL